MDVLDAVVLSELLQSRVARRVLLARDSGSTDDDLADGMDQRRALDPAALAARLRERAVLLV